MKVSKVGKVPIDRIFEVVLQSLEDDYQENTGKVLEPYDRTAGLSYVKCFGDKNQHTVGVKVLKLEQPNLYKVHFQSNRGDEFITYEFQAINEEETQVSYAYDFVATDWFGKANHFLMTKLLTKSLERQFDAQLQALIRHAKEKIRIGE